MRQSDGLEIGPNETNTSCCLARDAIVDWLLFALVWWIRFDSAFLLTTTFPRFSGPGVIASSMISMKDKLQLNTGIESIHFHLTRVGNLLSAQSSSLDSKLMLCM